MSEHPTAPPLEERLDGIADEIEDLLEEIRRLAQAMRDGKDPDDA